MEGGATKQQGRLSGVAPWACRGGAALPLHMPKRKNKKDELTHCDLSAKRTQLVHAEPWRGRGGITL